MLALTATVTKKVRLDVCHKLEMSEYKFVWASPERPNTYYEVLPHSDIDSDIKPIVDELRQNKLQISRVIFYCRSLNVCADLYAFFLSCLGEESYFPSDAPKLVTIDFLVCTRPTPQPITKKLFSQKLYE